LYQIGYVFQLTLKRGILQDVFPIWTCGEYKSTPHWIRHNKRRSSSISVSFSYDPSFDAKIEPLPNNPDAKKLEYAPKTFIFGHHLAERVFG
jgi:isopenicillin N synthase-like dioxygenase